ncbi:MAG: shikimate dehydrogenase [Clostridiales bacterium]|jgi:shikimate dehydrogenase|nr:shikimate dehydrogenase [Clostridiales bacterium]
MITARTDVLGVIGYPIEHSLSPQIHERFARAMNQDICYAAFRVVPERLGEAIAGAHSLGIKGLNVTIPHKQACLPFLSRADETARRIGAVNTLVYEEEGYAGYNTDYIGIKMSLKAAGAEIRGKSVVIIGAGGTARAACVMTADNAPAEIVIANRTSDNAELLAAGVKSFYNIPIRAVPLSELNNILHKDIVIQTTSVGLNEPPGKCPVDSESFFEEVSAALDLIYSPWETRFIQMARAKGVPAVNGFSALVYQAAASFELWRGLRLPPHYLDSVLEILAPMAKPV